MDFFDFVDWVCRFIFGEFVIVLFYEFEFVRRGLSRERRRIVKEVVSCLLGVFFLWLISQFFSLRYVCVKFFVGVVIDDNKK